MIKTFAIVLLFAAAFSSCGGYTPPDPVETFEVELSSLDKDTTFLLRNREMKDELVVDIVGNLSNFGALEFSPDSAKSDSSRTMVFGPGSVMFQNIIGGINGDQYVRYYPIRDAVEGRVTIKFTFQ